jgi:hypothetical protein
MGSLFCNTETKPWELCHRTAELNASCSSIIFTDYEEWVLLFEAEISVLEPQ